MAVVIAIVVSVVLFVIGLIHVYWFLGGRWGVSVVIPMRDNKRLFTPAKSATLVVVLLLWLTAFLLLAQTGLVNSGLPAWIPHWGSWCAAIVLYLRVIGDFHWLGLFKRETSSAFATYDTRVFVPLCFLLASGIVIVLVNT